jgi:phosphoribosylanthranilate isomerase
MLPIKVKAGGIAHLTDARFFAAWGVEWLGYDFRKGSPQQLDPLAAKAIMEWVEGPKHLGEFDLSSADEIRNLAISLALDGVQIGHFAQVETARELSDLVVFKEIIVEPGQNAGDLSPLLEAFAPFAQAFVLDFQEPNASQKSLDNNWKRLLEQYNIILKLDFNPDQLPTLLSSLRPYGIAITGGEEERVGIKSFDELDELFEKMTLN